MNRWWTATALLSSPIILGLEASPAAAQSQYAISIIMTTLGTDGTPVTTAMDLPPGSSVTVKTGPADMACPNMPVPDTNAGSTPGSGGGGGGGSGGGSGGGTTTPTSNNTTPSGATGNPASGGGPTDTPTPPATTDTPTGEPDVPAPPVVLPPTTTDPGTPEPDPTIPNVPDETGGEPTSVPVPTSPPGPNETPEPATLTLAALGILGAAGYTRRRKS